MATNGVHSKPNRPAPWQFIKETQLPSDEKGVLTDEMKYMINKLKFPEDKAKRWVERNIKAMQSIRG